MSIKPETEKSFMMLVVNAAHLFNWIVYHTFDPRKSEAGYPDLCMIRDGRIIYAELKTEKGKLTPPQEYWIERISQVAGKCYPNIRVFVWRPSQWEEIVSILC
jgi:hypothetical protein